MGRARVEEGALVGVLDITDEFGMKRLELDQNDETASAENMLLRFKGVPLFYFPRFSFPIGEWLLFLSTSSRDAIIANVLEEDRLIELTIPGRGTIQLKHLVSDVNGTLAQDGQLIPGVVSALLALGDRLQLHLLTADTHGQQSKIDEQLGFRYLTFVVTNLDAVCQLMESENIEFTRAKTEIAPGTTIAMVKDPDGNIVEFVERS